MTERIEGVKKAFKKKNIKDAKRYHTKKSISHYFEKHARGRNSYLKDTVYGALDGIITTFAVVSGVTGASLSSVIILILGFANLFGDGISMAVGNYLGTKSERDYYHTEKRREEWEVENIPEGERQEIREIYKQKGFKGKELERVVKVITSDKKLWVDEMMKYELGMIEEKKSPVRAGMATFLAFIAAGFVPLISYVAAISFAPLQTHSFTIAVILTAATIFGVGSARALVTDKKWYISGLEMLIVGGAAAMAAFYIGFALKGLVAL